MCGIFGAVSSNPVVDVLLQGLRRLEYRGYDSAGIATIEPGGLKRVCAVGKVERLASQIDHDRIEGSIGIAHTRWATHGAATEANSHPHMARGVAIVHNGIVENYRGLRMDLQASGARFTSETDSEVIPWLVTRSILGGGTASKALQDLSAAIDGSSAVALIREAEPDVIYATRRGSPLLVAVGKQGGYIASDAHALEGLADHAIALEDGDQAEVRCDSVTVRDATGRPVQRSRIRVQADDNPANAREYPHYMLKEIYEQPAVLRQISDRFADAKAERPLQGFDFAGIDRVRMVSCGSSLFASMVAKYWFAEVAGIAADIEIASEYRYMAPIRGSDREAAILVSQSGETADTLAAFTKLREQNIPCIGVVNNEASTLARDVDICLPLRAGPEIGVASTKAFTAQLAVLGYLAASVAAARGRTDAAAKFRAALRTVPDAVEQVLATGAALMPLAKAIQNASSALFVARGRLYPLALEGALKLKEISYIHAEGFAAGELKHGPIALIESGTPVIALAPGDEMLPKLVSNVREIAARRGSITAIGHSHALDELADVSKWQILLPDCDPLVEPIVSAIPLQLLAYLTAVVKGNDVDRPRNLAKSVTVE